MGLGLYRFMASPVQVESEGVSLSVRVLWPCGPQVKGFLIGD